jgi:AcrR family transcriptional regulator
MTAADAPAGSQHDLRSDILTAAEGLFIRRGYYGLSMREIAQAVGVSKAALYYHFKDKQELFLALLIRHLTRIEGLILDIRDQHPTSQARLLALAQAILLQPDSQRAVILLANQEAAHLNENGRARLDRIYQDKFLNRIEAILQDGIANGELKPLAPSLLLWSWLGMMYPYLQRGGQLSPELLEQLTRLFMDGAAL